MKALMTLSVAVLLTGCAGANVETTARYVGEAQATSDSNKAAAGLEVERLKVLGTIEIERIKARNKIELKELELKESRPDDSEKKRPNIERCISYKDEYDELYQKCLEMEIENYGVGGATGAVGHTISGNNNNIVIGSGRQEVNNGQDKQDGAITAAIIGGTSKNPFTPIPKPPQVENIAVPIMNAGVSVAEKIAYGFLGYKAFDAIGDALSSGSSRDSVRIDGDYVSQSNNPVTSTEYAPPIEP